jgi:hypothetical protein
VCRQLKAQAEHLDHWSKTMTGAPARSFETLVVDAIRAELQALHDLAPGSFDLDRCFSYVGSNKDCLAREHIELGVGFDDLADDVLRCAPYGNDCPC